MEAARVIDDSWSDWLAVGGQVVDLASSIASLFGEGETAASDPYTVGTVQWSNIGGTIAAVNAGQTDLLLSYSMIQDQAGTPGTSMIVQPLKAGNGYDATSDLAEFQGGSFSILPEVEADGDTLTQALTFAIKSISVAVSIGIVGGISAGFGKNPSGGYTFTIQSTGPQLSSAKVKVTDVDGTSADLDMQFTNSANDGTTSTVDVPPGLNMSPTVGELDITLQVDVAAMDEIVGDRRSRCVPIDELTRKVPARAS